MNDIPPSIMICECLDGPFRGRVERVAVNAQFVEIVDRFDGVIPPQWYQVVTVDFGAKELRWVPAELREAIPKRHRKTK